MVKPLAFMARDPVRTGISAEPGLPGRQAGIDLLRQYRLLRVFDPD